jgi:hypothetical protein
MMHGQKTIKLSCINTRNSFVFTIWSSQRQSTIQLAEYHKTLHDLGEATVIRET